MSSVFFSKAVKLVRCVRRGPGAILDPPLGYAGNGKANDPPQWKWTREDFRSRSLFSRGFTLIDLLTYRHPGIDPHPSRRAGSRIDEDGKVQEQSSTA